MPTKREMLFVLLGAAIGVGFAFAAGKFSTSKPADPVVVLETMQVVASSADGGVASSDAGGTVDAGLQESTKVVRVLDAGAHLDAGHADAGSDAGK